jgi:5-methylcytosine-specific restriction enzyme subunit McrC
MVDCSYFDYSHNVPKNQIIRSTLGELAKVGKFGPNAGKAESLAQTLRRLGNDLSGVDMPTVSVDLIRRQQLGRNDSDYRVMLNICDLLLGRNMPSEMEGIKSLPGLNREAMTLYRIYEKFVANFYKIHLEDWIISEQPVMDWFALKSSSFMPTMRPDLILSNKSTRRMVVLDTKFTAKSLVKNLFGKDIFDSAHLYQIYAYLRTQEALSDNHRYATGILLYPSVGINLRETIRLNDHQILILTINLAQPWSGIEKDLLEFLVN